MGKAQISDREVQTLRERAAAGGSLDALAREYGISPAAVTKMVTGQSRRRAGGPLRASGSTVVLTGADEEAIRELYEGGIGISSLARRYSVQRSRIMNVVPWQAKRFPEE